MTFASSSCPDLGEVVAQTRGKLDLPEAALRRLAHVGIDQQDALAEHGIADGDIRGGQALALGGLCARDGEGLAGPRLVRRHAEHQAGAKLDIGLLHGEGGVVIQKPAAIDRDSLSCCFIITLFHF